MNHHTIRELSNKLIRAIRDVDYAWKCLCVEQHKGANANAKGIAEAELKFRICKEKVATLMDAVHTATRDAGHLYRLEGFGRNDYA